MKYYNKQIILILLIIFSFSWVTFAVEIMPIKELKPGMIGIGKTVFSGYKVDSFPIEIIDVLENQGLDKDLILIKTGGAQIDEIGGIASGMSGSPIYIDDKLIGAIGYGWNFSDHHYCLVTPIEAMLELLENGGSNYRLTENVRYATPLFISGLNGRAFQRIEKDFSKYGFKSIPSGGIKSDSLEDNLIEPGSSIAVQLARGDINIASIGTITYIEDDKILAFGHPFMNKGDVEYLLSEAYISGVIPSLNQPFKLGVPGEKLLGSINIDSSAGIAGRLNKYPNIIPLNVKVFDKDSDLKKKVNVQIINEEDLLTSLLTNISLQAIDSTLDRIGKGTAKVKIKIVGNGLPDLMVEKKNIYYSLNDISSMALTDLYQLINLITTNPFQEINLIKVDLDIEVEDIDNVALVQEAKVLNENIEPGDVLELEITLHPYRKESFTKRVLFEIPEDVEPGMATIVIDGGFTGQSYPLHSQEELEHEQELNQAIIGGYKDFPSMLNDYLERPLNNELIIQLYPSYPAAEMAEVDDEIANEEQGKDKDEKKDEGYQNKDAVFEEKLDEDIKRIIETDYVLEGSLNLDINIGGVEENS